MEQSLKNFDLTKYDDQIVHLTMQLLTHYCDQSTINIADWLNYYVDEKSESYDKNGAPINENDDDLLDDFDSEIDDAKLSFKEQFSLEDAYDEDPILHNYADLKPDVLRLAREILKHASVPNRINHIDNYIDAPSFNEIKSFIEPYLEHYQTNKTIK